MEEEIIRENETLKKPLNSFAEDLQKEEALLNEGYLILNEIYHQNVIKDQRSLKDSMK